MIFAILFIIAFLISLGSYLLTNKWFVGALLVCGLFVINTLMDTEARDSWGFTLVFGLPIAFVASLLGAYVVELRRGEEHPQESNDKADEE